MTEPEKLLIRHMGITAKTAMLSWLVTIVTLAIFVAVIIPQQKRTFLENLNSKARGICASLQDVTAGAIVTEDYSSVVDHSRQVLQGDESIDFLVITKNDGFSLINESDARRPATGTALADGNARRLLAAGHAHDPWRHRHGDPCSTVGSFTTRNRSITRASSGDGFTWGCRSMPTIAAFGRSMSARWRWPSFAC